MKFIKPGTSMVEAMLAIAISAMLAIAIFRAFSNIKDASMMLGKAIDFDMSALILQNQLDKDIAGVFVPFISGPEVNDEKKNSKNKIQSDDQTRVDKSKESDGDDKKPSKDLEGKDKKESVEGSKKSKEDEKDKVKPLEKIFFSEKSDNNIGVLTFISSNPLQVFTAIGKEKIFGKPKPRIVRVYYWLEKSDDVLGAKKLMRGESVDLNYVDPTKKTKNIRAFTIVDGVKELSFEYTYVEVKKEKTTKKIDESIEETEKAKIQKTTMEETTKTQKTFKQTDVWHYDEGKQQKEDLPALPELVAAKIRFINDIGEEQTFDFSFKIYVPEPDVVAPSIKKRMQTAFNFNEIKQELAKRIGPPVRKLNIATNANGVRVVQFAPTNSSGPSERLNSRLKMLDDTLLKSRQSRVNEVKNA
ncbi:MAG: hypothetical protein UR26_C0001G0094 [candidate division TM6 bacterium GW2011_GWF2_32_72]|nr:MAG: hypothetical protein UR26_C0001G0094 [candidate division TM6 bacterium GW2011_GWF2_32_72]